MTAVQNHSYLTQVRSLRALAMEAIKQYPIKVKNLDFIKYSANAIFKITDTRHKKYLLRIPPAGFQTKGAILEEIKWLNHILNTTDILVPKPVTTDKGHYVATVRGCTLFEWIEGRFLWNGINKNYAYKVGALNAQLEASGKHLKIKHRHYWDTEGLVGTKRPRLCNVERLTGIDKKQQAIITAARRCAYKKLKDYEDRHPETLGLIHEDLNPNNIIIQKNNYGVIDFDDCGIGLYGYGLTAPLFAFEYLTEGHKKKDFATLKVALYQGYADRASLTQEDIDMIPYFLLARKLCALAAMEIRKDNPKLRPWFQKAIDRAIAFFNANQLDH